MAAVKLPYYVEPFEEVGRPGRFLETFAAILEKTNYDFLLDNYVRVGVKCGRCAESCPVYQTTGEARDIPCERSTQLLQIYKRYFTEDGKLAARFTGGFELTDEHIDRMAEDYYRCTACRRCKLDCPMGVDHGLITHLGRWILAEIGMVPKALVVATREQLEGKTGNTSAIPVPALKDNCEFLEEEFAEIYGVKIEFPFDVQGAEYVFFPAVSDYLMEPDTLMGNAAVMTATGASWTIGTGDFDGINYGLFYSDLWLARIVQNEAKELKRLGAKKVLIGECGHASRSAKAFHPVFCGGEDSPPVINIMEYTYDAWKSGKLRLRENVIEERTTYHDPCNIARSGWITEQPREILEHICQDFVDMTPNRSENYCCGGGAGTVSIDEIREFRTKVGGSAKAKQIAATGAKYVVSPCANCKKQIKEVCEDNGLDDAEVVGLHDLIMRALDLSQFEKVETDTGDEGGES